MPQDEASKVRLQEAKKDLAALGEELAPLRARYQQAHLGKVEAMETRYELSRWRENYAKKIIEELGRCRNTFDNLEDPHQL